ncbi:MAG: acyl carrier protein [Gemmatimonadota bacterium]
MIEAIREVLRQHGRLPAPVETLVDTSDLYQAGLSSHASVNLMLALEERFDIEFPERMLRRRTFESMAAMREAILELTAIKPAAG